MTPSRRRHVRVTWGLGVTLAVVTLAAAAWIAMVARRPTTPRLFVLVSIDTLRPDHLGCYGYPRPTSPHLDALAAESVVFDDVTSPAPWTLPAHASLLTGLYPSHHTLKTPERMLPASVATLADLFASAGFVTAAVVNSLYLSPRSGLEHGFNHYLYVEERADQREPSTRITDQAIAWLREYGGAPLFLFVHYYDVHGDYRSLPQYEALFVRAYTGRADGSTAQLLAARRGDIVLDARDAAHLVDLYDAGVRQIDDDTTAARAGSAGRSLAGAACSSDSRHTCRRRRSYRGRARRCPSRPDAVPGSRAGAAPHPRTGRPRGPASR